MMTRNSVLIFIILPLSVLADQYTISDCRPVVEINSQWQTMRLRSHENAFLTCTVSQDKFHELIVTAITELEIEKTEIKSLFIGRLVEYPWLSQFLANHALQHPDWNAEEGKFAGENINTFVSGILSAPELLEQIQRPFNGMGYIVTGASVEKVLIGRANEIEWLEINEPIMVPYDVMVHFILEQRGSASESME